MHGKSIIKEILAFVSTFSSPLSLRNLPFLSLILSSHSVEGIVVDPHQGDADPDADPDFYLILIQIWIFI
jgi:hypothetical protein